MKKGETMDITKKKKENIRRNEETSIFNHKILSKKEFRKAMLNLAKKRS